MASNASGGSSPMVLLKQGCEVAIQIDLKSMFEKIMVELDVATPPAFTYEHCGSAGMKVCIKIDVSNLPHVSGDKIWYSLVEGETMMNKTAAEASAIKSAFKLLQRNHRIRIVDFSMLLAQRLEGIQSDEKLSEAIASIENVIIQWDLTLGHFDELCVKLERKESDDNIYGPRSARTRVYGFLSDYLTAVQDNLHSRTNYVNSVLSEAKSELEHYQKSVEDREQSLPTNAPPKDVALSTKYILGYVMSFLGLPRPEYVNSKDRYGFVKSTVTIEFPEMEMFKHSGKTEIKGKSCSSVEADEEAAYEALVFIEENYSIKVVDYNYLKRQKVLVEQNILVSKISKVLEKADCVKMMFGELINTLEGQRQHFSFDPNLFFAGHLSPGQIEAYHFCANAITEAGEYSVKCYTESVPQFDVLSKLTWDLLVVKTNLPSLIA